MSSERRHDVRAIIRSFLFLLGHLRGQYLAVAATTAAFGGIGGLMHPLLIRAIFDEAARREDFSRFLVLTAAYLALCLFTNAGNYCCSLWQQRVDNRIVERVGTSMLTAYYGRSYSEVVQKGSGYYVARIRSDVKDGVVPMLSAARTTLTQLVTFVALISALLIISWQAFLVLAAIIPIATTVSVLVGRRIRELTSVERDKEAELVSLLTKAVGAFKMVCTFGLAPKAVEAHDRSLRDVLASTYQRYKVVRTLQGASDLTMVISDVCSIFVGALFVFRQQMTLGSFIAFMNAFWRSATTLIGIFKNLAEMHSYGVIVVRVAEFIEGVGKESASGVVEAPGLLAASIGFSYGATPVFSGFTMALAPAERALVIGDNGTGKTTLANVLAGYFEPTTGRLLRATRTSAITLPLQFPPLKVRDLGVDISLLARLGIDSELQLDSQADELSAGQQQKVALAMALSKDADLYILDEPVANLDTGSREIAMEAIFARTHGRMLVMIMHGAEAYRSRFDHVHELGRTMWLTEQTETAVVQGGA
jgi:ATP-binding cassette subfamily B protein